MRRDGLQLENIIKETIRQCSMYEPGGTIIVGCSGGADSMALLHFFVKHGYPVIAAHVNHGLRGEEALRDENFVRNFCHENQVPVRVHQEDVAQLAKQRRQSVEECGRAVRYDFFRSLCCVPQDKIATAHTLSDSVETVLFHLAKGSGSRGLSGIPAVRGCVVRPLIRLSRSDIEEYCHFYQIPYLHDSTNFSRDYARNRIRLDVVPVLRGINPLLETAVQRMSQQLEDDEAYLTAQAQEALAHAQVPGGYDPCQLASLPRPIQTRAIRLAVVQYAAQCGYPSLRLSYIQIEQAVHALDIGMGGVALPHGFYLRVERTLLSLQGSDSVDFLWDLPYHPPQIFTFNQHMVTISVENCANFKNPNNIHKLLFQNSLDYDTIASNATWRSRRPGDRFAPTGRNLSKSLKKLFNEAKIPPSKRDQVLLLEAGGEIVWLEGFGPAHGYGVTEKTARVVRISFEE